MRVTRRNPCKGYIRKEACANRISYSRVVYGNTTKDNSANSNNTQGTEVSTITSTSNMNDTVLLQKTMIRAVQNMQDEAKKGQQEMNNLSLMR